MRVGLLRFIPEVMKLFLEGSIRWEDDLSSAQGDDDVDHNATLYVTNHSHWLLAAATLVR